MTKLAFLKGKYKFSSLDDLARQLKEEGFSVFLWSDPPGTTYSNHSHPHNEFIVIGRGSITFIIENKDWMLEKGDALVLPAHTVHAAINKSRKLLNISSALKCLLI